MTDPSFLAKQQQLIDSLRPGQKSLAHWQGGKMAVAAVPGAGKSHSLSVAVALTIAREQLNPQRQLLIVTYTRSAAAAIKQKVRNCLKELGLPQWGFVVQTLHGLASSIAYRHPELHEIDLETGSIITINGNHQIIRDAVESWISQSPHLYQRLIDGDKLDGEETERLRRQSVLRTEVLPQLAYTVIHEAKSSGLSPAELWELGEKTQDPYQILAIASGLYQEYQNLMQAKNFLDYDDLILAALKVLENSAVRQIWQQQIYAVFEDEAQDSSPLQERLITLLALNSDNLNLVRVGDPNQGINSTFTPADPLYFNWFCQTCEQQQRLGTMDQAGRSSQVIINAANFALEWMNQNYSSHAVDKLDLPFRYQKILPVAVNDPQPEANSDPEGLGLEIYFPEDIYASVTLIKQRVIKLLKAYPQRNAAILVRENRQGSFIAQQLKELPTEHGIRVYEVAETQRHSEIPREILKLLSFLDRPHSPDRLKEALEILAQRQLIAKEDFNALATYPEQFLYPTPFTPKSSDSILKARRYCCNLLKAKLELPSYQLIAFLSLTLKYSGSELATVQKLSEMINQQIRGRNSLQNAIAVLQTIVTSEKFEAVAEDNEEQYTRPGQLSIITMHKAKGLDWDYVFIPFLHEDTLPGDLRVTQGAKFLGNLALAEVARVYIRNYLHAKYQGKSIKLPSPVEAWSEAKKLKKAEEFRLFYVAMTRAKRLLWLSAAEQGPFSWSRFSQDNSNLQPKKPFALLKVLASINK